MSTADRSRPIYTVVEVWRGMAQGAKCFEKLADAQTYMKRIRSRHNVVEDDVAIFAAQLHSSVLRHRRALRPSAKSRR